MAETLKVDLAELERAAAALTALGEAFRSSGDLADDAGAAAGHRGLASACEQFHDSWKVRRSELLEEITKLSRTTQTAVDTYVTVDQELASALTGGGQ